ncbi:MAG TPA: prolyl oligopeptidase family serine peptidase [Candidatus Nanopelagicales bacterium]|nr:prolyl oligopeptidase family serine peptidase [Candidatus Nanopelagicales bacterium]
MPQPPVAPARPDPAGDPYAWIADPAVPEVLAHLDAERAYYEHRVAPLAALRAELAAEMVGRLPGEESGAPWNQGGFAYRRVTLAGTEYDRLLRRPQEGGDEVVLLDLQAVHDASGSAYTRDGQLEISPDSRVLAWSVDHDGDELYTLRFRSLESGNDLDEVVPDTYYGGAWSADSTTFFYLRCDDAMRPFQVWSHVLGTPVSSDRLLLEDLDDRMEYTLEATRSGRYAVAALHGRGFTEVTLLDLHDLSAAPVLLRPREVDVEYHVEHAPGYGPGGADALLVLTDLEAPEFRVAQAVPGEWSAWSAYLDEDPAVRVLDVSAFARGLVLTMRHDGAQTLRFLPRTGEPFEIASDVAGGMARLGINVEWDAETVLVELEDFVRPAITYAVGFDGTRTEVHRREVVGADLDAYVCERRWVARPDGVSVPVILVRHRDTPLDGSAPCLLYGYGSYEACCDPDWGIDWWRSLPSLLDRGVVFAVGHPRGGGEMGRRWWTDGHLASKANTFDDQAAVAAYLRDGVVSSVVSRGLSAGGLLQGALYGRAPRLFAGVVAEVPFVDVVTTMLDDTLPLTAQEWLEWGDPRDPEQRAWLSSWSPIEHLPDVADRPPLLATGAVHDVRVLVREPARWVARLRASDPDHGVGDDEGSPTSPRTVLLRVETGAGAHGGPSGRVAELEYEAEIYAWVLDCLGREAD